MRQYEKGDTYSAYLDESDINSTESVGLKWIATLDHLDLSTDKGLKDAFICLNSRKDVLIQNRDEMGVSDEMMQNYQYYNISSPLENTQNPYSQNQSSHNMIRSCINTVVSQIGKNKPKVNVLTEKAPYDVVQQGKKADQYIEVQFEKADVYTSASDMILQANTKKTGVIKIWFDKKTECFKSKSINPMNFYCYIPREEGAKSDEKEVMEVKYIDKIMLMKKYPKMKEKIKMLETDMDGCVKVYCLYYAGKWETVFTENCVLEAKKNKRLPYFFWRWTNNTEKNFWGIGIADELQHMQTLINKFLYVIVSSAFSVGIPKYFVNRASDIVESHIDNKLGAFINYSGEQVPTVATPAIVHQQYFAFLEMLKQDCFLQTGVRRLSAGGEASASLQRSSTNMKTYNAIGEERFNDAAKRFEKVIVDIGKYMLIESSEYFEKNKSKDKFVKSIKWDVLDIKNNQYRIQTYPVNFLQEHPQSRLQDLGLLAQMQIIRPDQMADLIVEYPDIKRVVSLETAPRLAAQKSCAKIISRENRFPQPDPFLDIELQYTEAKKCYSLARVDDVDQEIINDLSTYLNNLKQEYEKQTQMLQQKMSQEQDQQFQQQMQLEQAKRPPEMPQAPGAS